MPRPLIDRVRQCIRELERELATYGYNVICIPGAVRTDRHHYYYMKPDRPIPEDWSIRVGEAVGHLRSSLEHSIFRHADGDQLEQKDQRRLHFPIRTDVNDWKRSAQDLRHLPASVLQVVNDAQPFHTPDPEADLLAVLSRLDNLRKHRRDLVVATAVPSAVLPWGLCGQWQFGGVIPPEGLQYARVDHDRPRLEPLNLPPTWLICINEVHINKVTVCDGLRSLSDHVEDVLDHIDDA